MSPQTSGLAAEIAYADLRANKIDRALSYGAQPRQVSPKEAAYYQSRYGIAVDPVTSGGDLFTRVIEDPKYYTFAEEIALIQKRFPALMQDRTRFLEMGPGDGVKTIAMIEAMPKLDAYTGLERSPAYRDEVDQRLGARFPDLARNVIGGDFIEDAWESDRAVTRLFNDQSRLDAPGLIAMVGNTYANYTPEVMTDVFRRISGLMAPDDLFVLGQDCTKCETALRNAYDNPITAVFFLNALAELNGLLGTKLSPQQFEYDVDVDGANRSVDMYLALQVRVEQEAALVGETVMLEPGRFLVGQSRKPSEDNVMANLEEGALRVQDMFALNGTHLFVCKRAPGRN